MKMRLRLSDRVLGVETSGTLCLSLTDGARAAGVRLKRRTTCQRPTSGPLPCLAHLEKCRTCVDAPPTVWRKPDLHAATMEDVVPNVLIPASAVVAILFGEAMKCPQLAVVAGLSASPDRTASKRGAAAMQAVRGWEERPARPCRRVAVEARVGHSADTWTVCVPQPEWPGVPPGGGAAWRRRGRSEGRRHSGCNQ